MLAGTRFVTVAIGSFRKVTAPNENPFASLSCHVEPRLPRRRLHAASVAGEHRRDSIRRDVDLERDSGHQRSRGAERSRRAKRSGGTERPGPAERPGWAERALV